MEELRNALFDADMNSRYWKYLVARYQNREKIAKIFVAFMASASVGGWVVWEQLPHVWKTLSAVSALTAIALPILNYPEKIEKMASLTGSWGKLRIQYEALYLRTSSSDESEIEDAMTEFRELQSELEEKEAKLPHDAKLLERCFNEVCEARNLI